MEVLATIALGYDDSISIQCGRPRCAARSRF